MCTLMRRFSHTRSTKRQVKITKDPYLTANVKVYRKTGSGVRCKGRYSHIIILSHFLWKQLEGWVSFLPGASFGARVLSLPESASVCMCDCASITSLSAPPVGSGTPAFMLGSRIDPHRHRGVVKVHWRVPWVGGLFSWVVATFTL